MRELPLTTQAVVINWKRPEETGRCLASLRDCLDESAMIVVDNETSEKSASAIACAAPRAVLLPQAENLGFGRAANIGIRRALAQGAEAVFLLNNDATVAPDALAHLAAAVAPPNRARHGPGDAPAIVSAKVFLAEEPHRLWAVGGHFRNRRSINLGSDELDTGQYDGAALDFVYGCAMLLRADVLRTVGLFDERFFAYYEDIDLCLRARAAGYRVALVPAAHAWHEGSRSTRDVPAFKLFHAARSRLLLFNKHLPPTQKPLFYAEELRYLVALTLRSLLAGDGRGAVARIRGYVAGMSYRE
jgi:GT2 family glycosyltransferase